MRRWSRIHQGNVVDDRHSSLTLQTTCQDVLEAGLVQNVAFSWLQGSCSSRPALGSFLLQTTQESLTPAIDENVPPGSAIEVSNCWSGAMVTSAVPLVLMSAWRPMTLKTW